MTQGSRVTGITAGRVSWTGDGVTNRENLRLTEDATASQIARSAWYYSDSGGNAVSAVISRIRCGDGGQFMPRFDGQDPYGERVSSGECPDEMRLVDCQIVFDGLAINSCTLNKPCSIYMIHHKDTTS